MKALSLRQPWAHAVLHLGKRVENRDWSGCSYRGPVLLHASKTLVLRDFDEDAEDIHDLLVDNGLIDPSGPMFASFYDMVRLHPPGSRNGLWRPSPTLPLGGIVGRAQIVGVQKQWHGRVLCDGPTTEAISPWYAGGFALVLADVEPLPFIPWKGSLGLFDVPDGIIEEAIRQRDIAAALGAMP